MLMHRYLTKRHKLRVQEIEDEVVRKYRCKICYKSFPYSSKLKKHRSGKLHKRRAKEAGKGDGDSENETEEENETDEDMMKDETDEDEIELDETDEDEIELNETSEDETDEYMDETRDESDEDED
jgi:hypothetical protein